MLPEEIKHQSLRSMKQQLAEDEDYCKETIESTRLEVVENITKYQQETKNWRDHKVIRKNIHDGDLVLRKKEITQTPRNCNPSGKDLTQQYKREGQDPSTSKT